MNINDLTMLQSWELRNICDCDGFEYHQDGPEFKPLLELVEAGLLIRLGKTAWVRFEATEAGKKMADEIERLKAKNPRVRRSG